MDKVKGKQKEQTRDRGNSLAEGKVSDRRKGWSDTPEEETRALSGGSEGGIKTSLTAGLKGPLCRPALTSPSHSHVVGPDRITAVTEETGIVFSASCRLCDDSGGRETSG